MPYLTSYYRYINTKFLNLRVGHISLSFETVDKNKILEIFHPCAMYSDRTNMWLNKYFSNANPSARGSKNTTNTSQEDL